MEYEINFLVLQSDTETLQETKSAIKELIEKRDGSITETLEYKKRKLAYKIKHQQYGFFTVCRFKVEGNEAIEKIKKDLNLLKTVARYIIVRTDGLPPLNQDTPQQQEKIEMSSKNMIKQEEIGRFLKEEKVAPASPNIQVASSSKMNVAASVEEKKPEKAPAMKESRKQTEAEIEQKQEAEKMQELPKEKAEERKKEAPASKKDKEKEEQDKTSLEDLDKKLDEILNS